MKIYTTFTGGKTKCRCYDICGSKENCSRCKEIKKTSKIIWNNNTKKEVKI